MALYFFCHLKEAFPVAQAYMVIMVNFGDSQMLTKITSIKNLRKEYILDTSTPKNFILGPKNVKSELC